MSRLAVLAALAVALSLPVARAGTGDAGAAEREYRVARRLAAEGSAQAGPALERVVELDPEGPLADDALIDLAILEGTPQWPEELGRISEPAAKRVSSILAEVREHHASGDRASEARVLAALLLLAPLPSRDAARARVELLAIATNSNAGAWAARARYCLVWLDEIEGRTTRAAGGFQRIFLDSNQDEAAVRSAVRLGRLLMRSGRFGIAAVWLQEAIDRGRTPGTSAAELRELAVRGVLREQAGTSGWSPERAERVVIGRGLLGFDRLPGGDWLVADRKSGVVSRVDSSGRPVAQWTLDDVQAAAVDPFGRPFVAAGTRVFRLEGKAEDAGAQGVMAPVSAIAVDAAGGVWMLDRKGGRVARLDAASAEPEVVWVGEEMRLADVVWDGQRIVGLDARGARLVAIGPSGATEVFAEQTFSKGVDLAVDAAGQVAVVDGRAHQVAVIGPGGEVRARLPLSALGVERAAAVALGTDGSLHVYDESAAAVVRVP
jgi:hypothetical protein